MGFLDLKSPSKKKLQREGIDCRFWVEHQDDPFWELGRAELGKGSSSSIGRFII
ncbi:hypothetical protein DSO57_1004643, partial [Entomophthora muscae]